jgi:signal transduction histidine kinase
MTDPQQSDRLTMGYAAGPEKQKLRVLAERVEFPITATARRDDNRAYMFLVAGDLSQVEVEIADFNGTLFWAFVVLGGGLILAILLQVQIGLRPLRRVSEALARIRDGKARRLEGHFPREIAPLASELNSLIGHSEEVVGRARTHVSNLAHFLKTPLTVLQSEAASQPGPLAEAVQRQVGTMRRQVDHYLARARAAGALDVLGNRTRVKPVLDDLARVLAKIHVERGLAIAVECPDALFFRGERQDLEEMAGNLIDNACKWANGKIAVEAVSRQGALIEIAVADDGPGLGPEDRTRMIERGERLDESVPGSGLGLAIVRDIAKLYGGALTLGQSALGGLEARLTLPAIADIPSARLARRKGP